jgi:transposase
LTTQPNIVSATQAQLDELLVLAKPTFPAEQYALLQCVLTTYSYVMRALQDAKTSLKRFRQMLFGAKTESKENVLGKTDATGAGDGGAGEELEGTKTEPLASAATGMPAPRRGHGRNAANAYVNSPVIEVDVPNLLSGDPCPKCAVGKVYESPPKVIVKVVGQSPLGATVVHLKQLRCRLCDAVFSAPMPAGQSAAPKYDHSCASMLVLLRYGAGMPFYRLQALQASLNVPLPDSTQWDIVSKALPAPKAVFTELIKQAAQAPLLHTDDTPTKILSLMAQRKVLEAVGQTATNKAINTTGIIAVLAGHKVALFLSGHNHAGDNLNTVLTQRARELEAPIQMSDALASNFTGEFATIVANCLTHGRRKFVDIIEHFPQECRYVIEVLAQVYDHDQQARDQAMTAEQRLHHHQAHSGAPMQALLEWMNAQLATKQVEPNSALGQALRYMIGHWNALTLFLRKAGAPLDNNICERALKRAILHRKNSLFYKTLNGAAAGDVYMSLIHTCELCHVNPFVYLQALQVHANEVMEHAALWLPWNFHDRLDKPGAGTIAADLVLSKSAPHYAGEPSRRQSGAALVRVGSPPISSTCNPHASRVRVDKAPSGQKEKHPLDSRFWHNQNPCPS